MKKIFIVVFILYVVQASCQISRHSVGFNTGYSQELFPDSYFYRITMFQGEYRYAACDWRWGGLDVVAQLQVNPTHYGTDYRMVEFLRSIEVGVTAGVSLRVNIVGDYFTASVMGFLGPLYTPHLPARQGGALNFSDNLAIALDVKLYRRLYLDLRGGFRHLSNAGLFNPNYGINSPWVGFGLFYKI